MKKLVIVIAVLGVLFLGLSLAKNALIKRAVQAGVKMATGLQLEIDSMNVGIMSTLVGIEGLRLRNPAGFEEPYMVRLPEIYVDYNLGALLQKKVYLEEARLNIEEFVVVTNDAGVLNLASFKPVKERDQVQEAKTPEEAAKGEAVDLRIDYLSLKVGRVVVKDYSGGGAPKVKTYEVNIDREYSNITSAKRLGLLVMTTALLPTGLNIPGLDLNQLNNAALQGVSLVSGSARRAVGSAVGAAESVTRELGESVGEVGNVTGETAETAAQAGKEVIGTATRAVEKTADSLKKLVPFGD